MYIKCNLIIFVNIVILFDLEVIGKGKDILWIENLDFIFFVIVLKCKKEIVNLIKGLKIYIYGFKEFKLVYF